MGGETWDFGDGTPGVTVKSDANADHLRAQRLRGDLHKYGKPGQYLVSVEHVNADGVRAVARLQVRVGID